MIFVEAVTTPQNTSKLTPKITQLPIVAGKITQIFLFFPPGVNALAHIKILWGLYQLFPSNEQGDFAGGDVLLNWPEDIDITTEPLQLTIVTWNDDDTYPHTITVHVVMTPSLPSSNVSDVIAALQQPSSSSP